MQVELCEDPRAGGVWTEAWDHGLADAGPLAPFLARGWLSAWHAAYAAGANYRLILAADAGRLQAALPVIAARLPVSRFAVDGLRYAAAAMTGRTGPWLAGAGVDGLRAVLGAFAELVPAWVACEIPDVEAGSRAHAALLAATRAAGMSLRAVPSRSSPYVECADSFAAWLASRGRNLRSNRNRKLNRLAREGKVEFQECLGGAAVGAVLPELFDVSRRSWKGPIGTDMAASPASRRFYEALAQGEARTHDVDAWLLRMAGQVIAVQVYWGDGLRKCLLRTDFIESAAALSPGDILQLHVIERCHALGVRELDLGGQSYGYKLRLTERVREHLSMRIYRRSIAGRLLHLGSSLLGAWRRPAARPQPATGKEAADD